MTNALRALKYIIQPGNLFWLALLALWLTGMSVWQVHYVIDGGKAENFLLRNSVPTLVFMSLQLAKTLDNAARITGGEADEPVPFGLFTRIPVSLPFRLMGGFMLVAFVVGVIASALRVPDGWRQFLFVLPIAVLTPGIYRIALEEGRFAALFKGRHWRAAIADMGGIKRYIQIIAVQLVLAFASVALFRFVVHPLLLNEESLKQQMMLSLLASGKISLPWQFYTAHLIDNVMSALLTSFSGVYWAFFVAPKHDTAAHDASDFGELAKLIPAERLAAMQAEPIDPVLLADADMQGMTLEAQIDLSFALVYADSQLAAGNTDNAETTLLPFVADGCDLANHFPAARRLYQLYREQGRTREQHALQQRLLALLVQRKHDPAYRLLRDDLAQIDPATLPADWIFPLAQSAAQHQDHDLVLHLGKQFARRHPEHPHIVDNYFLAARSLDKQGQSQTALQLLDQLLSRYPEHAKTSQIRHTRKLVAAKVENSQNTQK
ncbi:MAG: tetratricopeptide repeat protein [Cardiobacteriaceae bacterium]|nr:tetratricopeptide repeat protein [Cardiobacteriaceae bacterium]